jgi:hypothetical protein
VAAPIFSKIGEASARYLDLLPSSTGASVSKENASSPSSSIPKVEAP